MNKGSKDQKRKIEEVQKLLSHQKVLAAKTLLKELLLQRPNDPNVLVLLGIAAMRQHDLSEAQSYFQRALNIDDSINEAHFQLASIYLQQKRFDNAIEQYQKMRNVDASGFQAQINLALAFESNWRYQEAALIYQRLLQDDIQESYVYVHLANVMLHLEKPQDAITYLLKAQELEPKSVVVLNQLGKAYLQLDEKSKAIKYFEKALNIKPDDVDTLYSISQSRNYKSGHFPEIKKIQALLDNGMNDSDKILCHFALGKAYDETDYYERAYYHYRNANELSANLFPYDEKAHQEAIDHIVEIFDAKLIQEKMILPFEGNQPLFIIGLPYSGKSLLTHILSKHQKITHTGEHRLLLDALKKNFHFPEGIRTCDNTVLVRIAQEYINNLTKLSMKKTHFICDDMPDNHLLLGMIAILFPKAHIIHCTRHPMDLCLMHYFHHHSYNHSYAHDLTTLGKYYQDYAKLMGYWQSIGIQNRIEIKYEELVQNPQETLVNLFEALEIPLDLHLKLPTLYQHEINHWENYQNFLQPLIEVLYNS